MFAVDINHGVIEIVYSYTPLMLHASKEMPHFSLVVRQLYGNNVGSAFFELLLCFSCLKYIDALIGLNPVGG